MYARTAINLPAIESSFDYSIPAALEGDAGPGSLVKIPFGKRTVQGIILELVTEPAVPETKDIIALIDPQPVVNQHQLKMARWLAEQTRAPLIECLALMLPPGLSQQADSLYTLQAHLEEGTPMETRLVSLLERRGPLRGRQIQRSLSRTSWKKAADKLVRSGILARTSVLSPPTVRPLHIKSARLACSPEMARSVVETIGNSGSGAFERRRLMIEALIREGEPMDLTWLYAESGGSMTDLRSLETHDLVILSESEIWRDPLETLDYVPSTAPELTPDQKRVWQPIRQAIEQSNACSFLLHGVTGSGKTEIYLAAVAETLRLGKQAIILVPEISLTPQTVRRFVARFPGEVGLIHSRLSSGERYDTWRRLRAGHIPVVVGPRSALFAPLDRIGCIILDESHDDSYKEQSHSVRYHARTAAAYLADVHNCPVVCGSATPDITTRYLADRGQMKLLSLPNRILGHRKRIRSQSDRLQVAPVYRSYTDDADSAELPEVNVVDMREELKSGNRSLFSRILQDKLLDTIQAGHQAILFLNRRGGATYVFCRDCGDALRCPNCGTALTQHPDVQKLRCHHCSYSRSIPSSCPSCGSSRLKSFGAGTQRIEQTLMELFPGVRTLRWDRDTTGSKGSHDLILSHFANQRADILIGTQMIAKGLDLPLVTLVGIVHADIGLNLPDYRSPERTFQVLTQVAGRAGRSLLGGKVILQTYQPDNYVIQNASRHDYTGFYQHELDLRKRYGYPPFTRLARLLYRHVSSRSAEEQARHLARTIRARNSLNEDSPTLVGPAPCFYRQLGGMWRWQIIIRAADPLQLLPEPLPKGWSLDVDPVNLL